MTLPYFGGDTLDDVMRSAFKQLLSSGVEICPTKGPATELSGVLLEIVNPRGRISRTETRGKPFSCLGELCWYLAKSDDSAFISYYLPAYKNIATGGKVFGAYGPRLFNWKGINQFDNVSRILQRKNESRQAVIQIFDSGDIIGQQKEVPCTSTLQFMVRDGKLNMIANMRSNDIYLGLPHDVFCFTMLQELMARTLSMDIGTYKHLVGSLHLYKDKIPYAEQFLEEGWQSTTDTMPPMPEGDPQSSTNALLDAEQSIRTGRGVRSDLLNGLSPYWADLVRLLEIYSLRKCGTIDRIDQIANAMSTNIYSPFITKLTNYS